MASPGPGPAVDRCAGRGYNYAVRGKARRSSTNRHLRKLRELVSSALRGRGAEVYLFGSYARGEARGHSDVDLAVRPRRRLPPALLSQLRETIEESCVPYNVDLLDWREASGALRRSVLREGIRWPT